MDLQVTAKVEKLPREVHIKIFKEDVIKVEPPNVEVMGGGKVTIETIGIAATVYFPAGVLKPTDATTKILSAAGQNFLVIDFAVNESRVFEAHKTNVVVTYFVSRDTIPTQYIEGVHRPPIMIIRTTS